MKPNVDYKMRLLCPFTLLSFHEIFKTQLSAL